MSHVWSCNEWDQLEEVIVGNPLQARFPTPDRSTQLAEFSGRSLAEIPRGPFAQKIIEEAEEDEGREEDGDGPWQRQDGEQHAGDFVDHDDARILRSEHPLHSRAGPHPQRGDGDERAEQRRLVERDEPEGDEGDEAADGSRSHRTAPGASDTGDGKSEAIEDVRAPTFRPVRSRPPRRWRRPRSVPT